MRRLSNLLVFLMMVTDAFGGRGVDAAGLLVDDFSRDEPVSALGTTWRVVTDRVMGGESDARMMLRVIDGHRALCLSGDVSLANGGGFAQLILDLTPSDVLDASGFAGVRLVVRGNDEAYNLHLKTTATTRPWQSYRASFKTGPEWREVRLPFSAFSPHRVEPVLDVRRLRRLGVVAIGREMRAEICVAEVAFYADT